MAHKGGLIKKAAEAFAVGDYTLAHHLYSQAGQLFGFRLVRANLQLCEKRLAQIERRESEFDRFGTIDSLVIRERNKLGKPHSYILSLADNEQLAYAHSAEIMDALRMFASISPVEALCFLKAKGLQRLPVYSFIETNLCLPNDRQWLEGINEYLLWHSQAPIDLAAGRQNLFFRLRGAPKRIVYDGPKVSVIMPAFNAEHTLSLAAESILNQGWRNIELVIIDDCSSDSTWSVCKKLAEQDNRVVILRNSCNVGPYVSKNRALGQTSGEWVTGHDADDWALPDRIATQVNRIINQGDPAGVGHMIRVRVNGEFSHLGRVTSFSPDGCKRLASISTMFRREFLIGRLGAWDSVRFGADSELLARAELACGKPVPRHPDITMICLDEETSLTNHPEFGVSKTSGLSLPRKQYRESWTEWHKTLAPDRVYLAFPHVPRLFDAPVEATVDDESIFGLLRSVPSEKAFSQ